MSAQREGFLGDILDKVKDIITDDKPNPTPPPPPQPTPQPKPPVEPKCCGPTPKFAPTAEDLTAEESKVHDADCPNHPDNLPKDVVA